MLSLRALEPEDLEFLYRIENDRNLWPLSSTTVPYSHRLLEDYILNSTGDIFTDKQVRLVIEADGEPVGLIDLFDFNATHRRAELGIVVTPEHRRKGYASEAVRLLEEYAATTIHLHQIYAIVDATNEPSLTLLRRQGFTYQSTLPEWLFDGQTYSTAILLQKILLP